MIVFRIVIHALAAIAPTAGGAWLVLSLAKMRAEDVIGYGCALAGMLITAFLAASWLPLVVLIAIRRAPFAPGEQPVHRHPLHPLGLITGIGGWGLVASCLLACRWGRDSLPTILAILMGLLFLIANALATRYVTRSAS
jgi:hypothetical protein